MIKFIASIWRKLFPVEEYVPDLRPVEEIPRCGWALGAKLVDNPEIFNPTTPQLILTLRTNPSILM